MASVSRKADESENTADRVNIAGDLSDPSSVAGIFSKVKESLGVPSVVVYNGASSAHRTEHRLTEFL